MRSLAAHHFKHTHTHTVYTHTSSHRKERQIKYTHAETLAQLKRHTHSLSLSSTTLRMYNIPLASKKKKRGKTNKGEKTVEWVALEERPMNSSQLSIYPSFLLSVLLSITQSFSFPGQPLKISILPAIRGEELSEIPKKSCKSSHFRRWDQHLCMNMDTSCSVNSHQGWCLSSWRQESKHYLKWMLKSYLIAEV